MGPSRRDEAAPAMKYSIVIPVFNEEDSLSELHRRLTEVLDGLEGSAEVILVDDGSTDNSYERMLGIQAVDPRFKVVNLSRNFGQQVALSAGIDFSSGEAVITMDADLQHPPAAVLRMVALWEQGAEVVLGVKKSNRHEGFFKRLSATLFYKVIRRLSPFPMVDQAGDFRLLDRKVVEALKKMPERNRYLRGMVSWVGFRQVLMEYQVAERFAGETKYPFARMFRLAVDGIFAYSSVPLQMGLAVGALLLALAFCGGVLGALLSWRGHYDLTAVFWFAVMGGFFTGAQIFFFGITGIYIRRMHEEAMLRPLYLVRNIHGFDFGIASGEPSRPVDWRARKVSMADVGR